MEPVRLNPAVAHELVECLEFLCDWIDHDHTGLSERLCRFTPSYGIGELRDDLGRFANSLGAAGGTNGEAGR